MSSGGTASFVSALLHSSPEKLAPGGRERKPRNDDTRWKQVKAAVRPSEKAVFEELGARRGSLSNVIRDYLIAECVKEGLLPDGYE